MSFSSKQFQAYNTAMQTMPGTRQIVMLYDGVIRYLMHACEAMRGRRIQERYNNLTRASEIIFGMRNCLDFTRGGDVAKTLFDFYSMVDGRIFSLHRSNDAAACEELIADIKRMRDVWAEIDTKAGSESTARTIPPADAAATSSGSGAESPSDPTDGMAISA